MRFAGMLLILAFVFSCAPKPSTLEEYEMKNPYPVQERRVEYAGKGSLMPKEGFNDLYSDLKASKVGDIIYVQVIESIDAVESVANQIGRSASFKELLREDLARKASIGCAILWNFWVLATYLFFVISVWYLALWLR
jgi:flagellar basal body L-ring protein FlgH